MGKKDATTYSFINAAVNSISKFHLHKPKNMKRNKFILSILSIIAAPVVAFSHIKTKRTDKGFKVSAREGRIHGHIKLKGVNSNILDVKISGTDNDGGFALFEQTSLSQGMGTSLHIHYLQDEVFYVIEGNYFFQVGEDKYQLSAGDSIFLPMKFPMHGRR